MYSGVLFALNVKNSPQSIFFTLAPLLMLATTIRYAFISMALWLHLVWVGMVWWNAKKSESSATVSFVDISRILQKMVQVLLCTFHIYMFGLVLRNISD